MKKYSLAVGVAVLLAAFTPQAEGRGWVRVGIGIGFPVYPAPWYGPYCYPYYQPYPVYAAPAPVYLAPPQTVLQPAPTAYQPVQAVRPLEARSQSYDETAPPPRTSDAHQADINRSLQQLSNQEERARSDAALELGRMKAQQAIDPLCTMLNTDRSPLVRETAARALGLISNVRALSALQNAALADSDREVRHSAQFSAEVIRGNLRKE